MGRKKQTKANWEVVADPGTNQEDAQTEKVAIFEKEIGPLVEQIVALCREHRIICIGAFQLADMATHSANIPVAIFEMLPVDKEGGDMMTDLVSGALAPSLFGAHKCLRDGGAAIPGHLLGLFHALMEEKMAALAVQTAMTPNGKEVLN